MTTYAEFSISTTTIQWNSTTGNAYSIQYIDGSPYLIGVGVVHGGSSGNATTSYNGNFAFYENVYVGASLLASPDSVDLDALNEISFITAIPNSMGGYDQQFLITPIATFNGLITLP